MLPVGGQLEQICDIFNLFLCFSIPDGYDKKQWAKIPAWKIQIRY